MKTITRETTVQPIPKRELKTAYKATQIITKILQAHREKQNLSQNEITSGSFDKSGFENSKVRFEPIIDTEIANQQKKLKENQRKTNKRPFS